MRSLAIRSLGLALLAAAAGAGAAAAPRHAGGSIFGVVFDTVGTPQMGAAVTVLPEGISDLTPIRITTNEDGRFSISGLLPGAYSIQVTMAGFLPALEKDVRVLNRQTTRLQIELGSVFSTFEVLRRQPNQVVPPDEWSWVVRTTGDTRPVLRWDGNGSVYANNAGENGEDSARSVRGRLELTSGARHPGSVSNLSDSPSTAFAYDESLRGGGRLIMAGDFSYDEAAASGGFAAKWLTLDSSGGRSVTTVVARETQLGPAGPIFRGIRLAHDSEVTLGSRISVRYGGEYLTNTLVTGTATGVRPHGEVAVQVAPGWIVSGLVATRPWQESFSTDEKRLESALDSLDSLPALVIRDGQPVLEDGTHEELAVEHTFTSKTSLAGGVFHDQASHTVVFGLGAPVGPDFLPDYFSKGFAYDAGATHSWGGRVAYRQRLSRDLDATFVYAWAGALGPDADSAGGEVRNGFTTLNRQSVAGRVTARLPRTATELAASYKWLNALCASRQDPYGEAFYGLDPYLNLRVRQPLPGFIPGHMNVLADFGNLLTQGYIPSQNGGGKMVLVPAIRSFRGGVSVQF